MFRPEHSNALSRIVPLSLSTKCIQRCDGEMKRKVMEFHGSGNVWIEKGDRNVRSSAGFIELLPDETTTTSSSTALGAYHAQAILFNAWSRRGY